MLTFVWLLFFSVSNSVASEYSLSERYPNRLITSDFGIVTADDLAYDATQRNAIPYDPNKRWLTRYWQCLPVKNVAPKYEVWLDRIALCDLEIHVQQTGELQIYGDRRMHPVEYCHEFKKHWEKLTHDEVTVCLGGDFGNYDQDVDHGKYKSWIWNKFKTRKGCYAYFGDCNVKGCAQGTCPQ